jgi:urease accessory protein UreH
VYAGGSELLDAEIGLAGFPSVGTLVAAGPRLERVRPLLPALREAMGPGRHGVSCLDDVLVARALAGSAEEVRRILVAVWRLVREPLSGAPPTPPRIWAT